MLLKYADLFIVHLHVKLLTVKVERQFVCLSVHPPEMLWYRHI